MLSILSTKLVRMVVVKGERIRGRVIVACLRNANVLITSFSTCHRIK